VGILRYFGEIEPTSGLFCGVELDEPVGRHDGSVQSIRYFTCRPQHGIFAPVGIVRLLPGHSWQQPPDRKSAALILNESGPYSLLDGSTVEQVEQDGEVDEFAQTQVSTLDLPRLQYSDILVNRAVAIESDAPLFKSVQPIAQYLAPFTETLYRKHVLLWPQKSTCTPEGLRRH
jgi:hypothetical protein